MVKRSIISGTFLAVIFFACEAAAGVTFFTSRAAFNAIAGGGLVDEDFNTFWSAAPAIAFNGFSVTVATGNVVQVADMLLSDSTTANQIYDIAFDNPTTAFGVEIQGFGGDTPHDLTISSDTASFLNHVIASTPPTPGTLFFGVIDDAPFNSLSLDTGIGDDRIFLEDVSHGTAFIPEPSRALLALLGFGALLVRRRRG